MRYQRFEELPVWNDAIELAVRLLKISQSGRLNGLGDLKSQLERAAISIPNNIAEGFERGTNDELLSFLYIAKGSAAEVRSMLHLLARLPDAGELSSDIGDLAARVEKISRQLGRWIESLKDSPYKGKRYQNSRTRQAADAARRRDRFLEKVRVIMDEALQARRTTVDGAIDPARAGDVPPSAEPGGGARSGHPGGTPGD